jgi:hypothetical protein
MLKLPFSYIHEAKESRRLMARSINNSQYYTESNLWVDRFPLAVRASLLHSSAADADVSRPLSP